MQISGESNNQDLSSQTLFLLGGYTTTQYPLKDQIRNMNEGQSIIWPKIFRATNWQYDDGNQTDLPSATQNLVASTASYALPTGTLAIRGVEVKASDGTWTQLTPLNIKDITGGNLPGQSSNALDEFNKSNGSPKFYRPVGNTVMIYPPADTSVTNGFKVYFDRGSVAFAYNATTTTPGFASEFHMALAVYAALQFCKSKPKGLSERIPLLERDWVNYIGDELTGTMGSIEKFYASRWPDKDNRMIPLYQDNK